MTIDNTVVIDKWVKVREITFNAYESRIDGLDEELKILKDKTIQELLQVKDRTLLAVEFLQKYHPECDIQFTVNEESNKYGVKINCGEYFESLIARIIETGEVPEILPELKQENIPLVEGKPIPKFKKKRK